MNLDAAQIEAYLARRFGSAAQVLSLHPLGEDASAGRQLKAYGYGKPVLIRYRADGREQRAVLRTIAPSPFGHEQRSDRAAGMLLSYDTFNDLPQHVRALDVGMLLPDGRLSSLHEGDEFFLLTDYVDGALYADDLQRLRDDGRLAERDLRRAERLARYLAEIHRVKRDDPSLYRRAVRDAVGGGEGIFGLTDSYPADASLIDAAWLERVEHACVRWRWRLKGRAQRLAQTHGDFHPFNVVFGHDVAFWLLDRSRGGWGEPADDVTCMAINYLFFSLQRSGELAAPFDQLWDTFWTTYLQQTGDHELLELAAPFFAWRALVLASPLWYNVADSVRRALMAFVDNVLAAAAFDPAQVNAYLRR